MTGGGGVERFEVDGVPVFGAAVAGPARAGLLFGVGPVDEPPARRGLTHFVEHLAIEGLVRPVHPYNGFTAPSVAGFVATGDPDEVGTYLTDICRSLRALPEDRFEQERGVLVAESLGRADDGVATVLMQWRYGLQGWGLLGLGDYGLPSVTFAELTSWAATRFTRANAAVWVIAPEPRAVLQALPLPPGATGVVARATSVAPVLPRFPCWARAQVGGPAIGFVAPRGTTAQVTLGAVCEVAEQRLRRERGITYSVAGTYTPIGPDDAHLHIGADAEPEHHDEIARSLWDAVLRVGTDGPPAGVIERLRRQRALHRATGTGPEEWVAYAAERILDGRTPLTMAELEAEDAAVEAAAVQAAAAALPSSALMVVPIGMLPPAEPFVEVPDYSDPVPLTGREYVKATAEDERLHVSADRIVVTRGFDQQIVVDASHCPLVSQWDDGTRVLHGRDGFQIAFRPWDWRDGAEIQAAIDAFVPADRFVRRGEGGGPPPPVDNRHWLVRGPRYESWINAGILFALGAFFVGLAAVVLFDDRQSANRGDAIPILAIAVVALAVGEWVRPRRRPR